MEKKKNKWENTTVMLAFKRWAGNGALASRRTRDRSAFSVTIELAFLAGENSPSRLPPVHSVPVRTTSVVAEPAGWAHHTRTSIHLCGFSTRLPLLFGPKSCNVIPRKVPRNRGRLVVVIRGVPSPVSPPARH